MGQNVDMTELYRGQYRYSQSRHRLNKILSDHPHLLPVDVMNGPAHSLQVHTVFTRVDKET